MIGEFVIICKRDKWTPGGSQVENYGIIQEIDYKNKKAEIKICNGKIVNKSWHVIKVISYIHFGWMDLLIQN